MGSREYMLTAVSIMYVQRYMQIEYTKTLNDVLNQNTTTSKRARFAIFAISVVDNLLLSQFRTSPPPPRPPPHSGICHFLLEKPQLPYGGAGGSYKNSTVGL